MHITYHHNHHHSHLLTFVPAWILAALTDTFGWGIAPDAFVGQTPKQTGKSLSDTKTD